MELEDCIAQLCGDTPNLVGAARASHVYFVNAEVAEAAARSLAELMGGVMDVSKSSKAETSSTTPAQGTGTAFSLAILMHRESKRHLQVALIPMHQSATPALSQLKEILR